MHAWNEKAAGRVAVGVERDRTSQNEISSLRDQLSYAEAALAKSRREQNRSFLRRLLTSSRRLRREERQLVKSGLFDADWYVKEYPDIAKHAQTPVRHYLEEGYLRGYMPNPYFHTQWYLERNDDVRQSGINPAIHYLNYGAAEGRDPGPDFETTFYVLAYPDVRRTNLNPLAHYLLRGQQEGRLPARRLSRGVGQH